MNMQYYYAILEKIPMAPVLVVGSENGVASISMKVKQRDIDNCLTLFELKSGLSPLYDEGSLIDAIEQLKQYFAGERTNLDFKLDFSSSTVFRRKVYRELMKVKAGQTISYGKLAEAAGNPKASRAVGSAMAENPLPLVIPCHRVLKSDGSLGGYSSGLDMKRKLLRLEGVNI
ncbi:MAG: methylated-DNA--[protein]-cysteine S-methyltransferase [candidate division Zixibacteria bacterium]|nr:methylated-DNA--[protein]-cysteine S-methyltransferase [candidate division Zixibacteria bacterium]